MFAAISSFLPSALQNQEPKTPSPNPNASPPTPESPQQQSSSPDEVGVKKKRNTNETFIVVRPPPSKSNHPLNLQVQLVPPQFRDRNSTNRRSVDLSSTSHEHESDDNVLTRTPSNRSDVSMYSGYSSVASFSSTASSTSSSRRMIIPLYNLQAHNVMTNVIVDAGTDAKVARFMKRGLELIGLAVLEPVEVFGTSSSFAIRAPGPASSGSARTSIDAPDLRVSPRPGEHPLPHSEGPHTPTSSSLSVSSAGYDHADAMKTPTGPSVSQAAQQHHQQQPTGAKKIFGKLFKRKDSQAPNSSTNSRNLPTPPPSASSVNTTFSKPSRTRTLGVPSNRAKRMSGLGLAPSATMAEPPSATSQTFAPPASGPVLQPAILGVQPLLSAPTYPPHGRPHSYAWVVRRWIKGAHDGLLANVVGMMNNIALSADDRRASKVVDDAAAAGPQVEVQFIWSRGVAKAKKRRERVDSAAEAAGTTVVRSRSASRRRSVGPAMDRSNTPSMASLDRRGSGVNAAALAGSLARRNKRLSTASDAPSMSTSEGPTEGSRRGEGDDDAGEESDPEDSETPWTCTLVVRRVLREPVSMSSLRQEASSVGHGSGSTEGPAATTASGAIRLKVATVSPTPHHPKVVAMLKIPFPLPDIVVDQMHVCRRQVTPQGIARPSWDPAQQTGLALTAEEIKDVVSSTALWLVVREGIGGVGKVSRKGDGWRIRA